MMKFVGFFLLFGFVIPCVFTAAWAILEKSPDLYMSIGGKLETVQLLIWPTSIFMMATASNKGIDFKMLAIAIAANILLYALIGFLIWWGLNRQRWVFFVVCAAILLGWYRLFTL